MLGGGEARRPNLNMEIVGRIGVGLGHSQAPKKLLDAKAGGNKTYFLVNNERFFGRADELGMDLIAAYPKATKPDGNRQALLFFEITDEALELNPEAY